jgi:cellulose synthase/poly-beta-1,6-N-acetylglucosamine synthase-like glycosyltransferase
MNFHPPVNLEFLLYLVSIFCISLIDFVVIVRARFARAVEITETTGEDEDFTILIPIFGDMKYLKNIKFLEQYSKHVILCTTNRESEEFNEQIEAVAKQKGFRIFRSKVPLSSNYVKPNPWALFTYALTAKHIYTGSAKALSNQINRDLERDEIIRESFSIIKTKFCIYLDGDTVAKQNLRQLVHKFQTSKLDLASVRVLASKNETLMEKLQSLEYELAMDARKIYPWLTSGASMISTTDSMKNIMSHHSLFFSGGDIEIGKLAKMLGHKVGHIKFEFYTDVPPTFKAWFRQRRMWFGGGFRHAIINLHQYSWKNPMFYFYTTVLVYSLAPLRIYEMVKYPAVLLIVIVLYWMLVFAFNWQKRGWHYFLVPFYALTQILVLVPLGMCTYFILAFNSNNVGLIKFRKLATIKAPRIHNVIKKYSA